MQKRICYTDGSYQESINAGGWASIILDENNHLITRLYQGATYTSNNRMELKAVIETLKYFNEPTDITIISDSQYVISNIVNGTAKKWLLEGDFTKKNLDLWFELLELWDKHKVEIKWVKGHNGDKWNEEADKWCTFAAKCLNLPKDLWITNLQ